MNFQLFSDIHLEFMDKKFIQLPPQSDYLFLAGDIGKLTCSNFKPFFDYCSENWKKVFYVLGNHEYYHSSKTINILNEEYKIFFKKYDNIILLDDSYYDLEVNEISYRIYGTTLWAAAISTNYLNDFKNIKMKNNKNWTVGINLFQFNYMHEYCLTKLVEQVKIANDENKNLIIMTHFPPLRKTDYQPNNTSHPKYDNDSIDNKTYFGNDLTRDNLQKYLISEEDFYKNILLWISGHSHYSYDFSYHSRFISNQIGYQGEEQETIFSEKGIFHL